MINETNLGDILNHEQFIITGHQGNSMYPLIKADDQLLIMKLNNTPKLYDIVAYKNDNKYILHRIIGEDDKCYLIRGDNTLNIEYIEKERIVAYLDTIYRKDKDIKINDKLNKKYYYLSIITLPFRKFIYKLKQFIKKLIKYE